MATVVCLVIALVLFFLATVSWPPTGRFNLVGGGLFFLTLALLLDRNVI